MSPRTQVIAAVITRGDRLLVCQRPLHKRYGGLWEFPGGKCEPDESIADAAQRELHEELSVQVVKVGVEEIAIPDPGSSYLIVFIPVHIVGEPACNEHIALLWATPSELKDLPLAPTDKQYIEFRLAKSNSMVHQFTPGSGHHRISKVYLRSIFVKPTLAISNPVLLFGPTTFVSVPENLSNTLS